MLDSIATPTDVFFLGAGKPAAGDRPAALKEIGMHTRALDWQLYSLTPLPHAKIHFLGGYHIEEIIASYPQLHYTVVPEWQEHSIIHTLLEAPWRAVTSYVLYADTLFRPEIMQQISTRLDDVVFVYDSTWQHRYENRQASDIAHAEVVTIDQQTMEFTGLIKFSPAVSAKLATLTEEQIGRNLIDLIHYLEKAGFNISTINAKGHWTEFNSPLDIAHFVLGTKAETLARLAPLVKQSTIDKQFCFTVAEWQHSSPSVIQAIMQQFPQTKIIIRSSAKSEDNWLQSNAGGNTSILNIDSTTPESIAGAITQVINSYTAISSQDQILVQELLADVQYSGVVFTRILETGAPYYRINFDDQSFSTESVTGGLSHHLRTILISHDAVSTVNALEPKLIPVIAAIQELETLLDYDRLDIEFAVDRQNNVHIFQARPITVDHSKFDVDDAQIFSGLKSAVNNFKRLQMPSPFIVGTTTLYGVMPDWNPAEIIGTRPRPLAFSLYRFLITDDTWAQQRAEFGYKDVRPQPLLAAFCGQPYVDIRASLNSFIPATVSTRTAEKLVNVYLTLLQQKPYLHDKLEFAIAFTVWTPTFQKEAQKRLMPLGITLEEIKELALGLKKITAHAFNRLDQDLASLSLLEQRRNHIINSKLSSLDKAVLLLEDCRRFGTLAFAHAARAGFVAMSFLNSLVSAQAITVEEKQNFLNAIKTVAGELEEDAQKVANKQLPIADYCAKYGHLRPGTYDITIPAYWEDPERYLLPKTHVSSNKNEKILFAFSTTAKHIIDSAIAEFAPQLSFSAFTHYLSTAIQAREFVKFKFTINLSRALDYLVEYSKTLGLSRDEMSYLEWNELKQLKTGHATFNTLSTLINQRKKSMQLTKMIELPQLITNATDFYCFERMAAQPNYITTKCITAPTMQECAKQHDNLQGHIILIPQADPGYDWLFAHDIAGLVTKYGGANSHMAIRAAEMALPAAIGVGDKLYEELSKAHYLHLDCASQQIRGIL